MIRNWKFTISLIDILTVIYCGYCVLELSVDYYKYICLAILLLWVIVAYLSDRQALINAISNKIVLLLFLYILIYFLYAIFTTNLIYGLKIAFTIIIRESPFMLFLYYSRKLKNSDLSKVFPWIEFFVILYLCKNILQLIAIDSNAARRMAAYTNIYQDYITGGGYELAYALCLLVPFLIFTFKEYKYKLVPLIFIIVFVYTLIKCSYTIALLLAVFELFLLIYWSRESSSRSRIIAVLCFILIIVIIYFLRDLIGDIFIEYISPLFSGTFVQRRMIEFGEFIKGEAGDANGAIGRMELYSISIKTFLDSPIIGISYLTEFTSTLEANYQGVRYLGLHSSIFDGFARIGFSFVIYVVYFWKVFCCIKKYVGRNSVMIIGTIFFLIKILNLGDAFALSYVAYFAIPMLYKLMKNEKNYTGGRYS